MANAPESHMARFERLAREELHRSKPNLRAQCSSELEYQLTVQAFVDEMKDRMRALINSAPVSEEDLVPTRNDPVPPSTSTDSTDNIPAAQQLTPHLQLGHIPRFYQWQQQARDEARRRQRECVFCPHRHFPSFRIPSIYVATDQHVLEDDHFYKLDLGPFDNHVLLFMVQGDTGVDVATTSILNAKVDLWVPSYLSDQQHYALVLRKRWTPITDGNRTRLLPGLQYLAQTPTNDLELPRVILTAGYAIFVIFAEGLSLQ